MRYDDLQSSKHHWGVLGIVTLWKSLLEELARERHGFPRGEAGRRSLTDEDRRNLYFPMQSEKTYYARTFSVLCECIRK